MTQHISSSRFPEIHQKPLSVSGWERSTAPLFSPSLAVEELNIGHALCLSPVIDSKLRYLFFYFANAGFCGRPTHNICIWDSRNVNNLQRTHCASKSVQSHWHWMRGNQNFPLCHSGPWSYFLYMYLEICEIVSSYFPWLKSFRFSRGSTCAKVSNRSRFTLNINSPTTAYYCLLVLVSELL